MAWGYCVSNILYILFRHKVNNEGVEYIVDRCINDPLGFFIANVFRNLLQTSLITIALGIFGGLGGKFIGSFSSDGDIDGAVEFGAEISVRAGTVALNICTLCLVVSTIIKYNIISKELKNENSTKKEISGINAGGVKLNKLGNFEADAVFNNTAY